MNEFAIYTIFIVVWFALQLWILPKLGIPTCMSGACSVPPPRQEEDRARRSKEAVDGDADSR